jgi:hypothetical protein
MPMYQSNMLLILNYATDNTYFISLSVLVCDTLTKKQVTFRYIFGVKFCKKILNCFI